MSGMVTMRARNVLAIGMPHWGVGRWPTSAGIRTLIHRVPLSLRSKVLWFVPRTPGCWHSWVQVFPVPLKKKSWVPLN